MLLILCGRVFHMTKEKKILGVLGGLGPMSSVYFYELLTKHTQASKDQEHLDIILSSHATTPDRTAYILGTSDVSPLETMICDAQKLQEFGAGCIAVPCNTAHYFYEALSDAVSIPIINMMRETSAYLYSRGVRRAGVLATSGTVSSHTYRHYLQEFGVEEIVPPAADQSRLMDLIYQSIKHGAQADIKVFREISSCLLDRGAECLIIGCTELSLIKKCETLSPVYVDALEILALQAILECGHTPCGFDL